MLRSIIAVVALLASSQADSQPRHDDKPAAPSAQSGAQINYARSTQSISTLSGALAHDVTSKDGDAEQAEAIRSYLRQQKSTFEQGQMVIPSKTPPSELPYVAELQANPRQVTVQYDEIPNGGRLTYKTANPTLMGGLLAVIGQSLREQGVEFHLGGLGVLGGPPANPRSPP